jgi:hypothetical protein
MIIMTLFISLFGCNDDKFLRENPSTFYTTENIYSTSEQVDQVLVSIYSYLRDLRINPGESAWIFDLKGKGTDMYDVANIRKGSTFSDYSSINPNHTTFKEVYAAWYTVISRANMAVYAASLPQITWASETEKAYVVGQARFFRAYAYMNLAELFGGVPIVTEIATAPRYDYARATRLETYRYAIEEMEAIINDIPETTVSGGRLIRGAVQHYLCELYLAMGTQLNEEGKAGDAQSAFTNSVRYADMVIDGGLYSLMNTRFGTRREDDSFSLDIRPGGSAAADVVDTICFQTNHYWDLFQDGNINYQDGNKECVWAIQIDYDAYRAEDTKSKLNYSRAFGPILRDVVTEWIAGMLEDIGGRGISQINLTMYARDGIYEGKFGEDIRNSDAVFRRRFKGNVPGSPYYLKDIPWEAMYNKAEDENTNMLNRSSIYPISCKIFTDRYLGLDAGENRSNLFRDDYYIRLSETILLRAEAKQRNGDKTGAAADINLLRARAQATYMVTAGDMDDAFNMILDERARELIYEENRWNTLLRMGSTIAVDRIRKYAFWPETAATLTFNYNLWPIPQSVIDVNKDIPLEQNPGWVNR